MIMPRRTVTNDQPFTRQEVNAFADSIRIGETLSTIITIRKWKSTTTFTEYHKPAMVTILKKYPYLVQTDKGIMTWNDLVLGYYQTSDGFNTNEVNEKLNKAA